MSEYLTHSERKARKAHTCDTCAGPIAPGDRYRNTTMREDGIYAWKECRPCLDDDVPNRVTAWALWSDGYTHDTFVEWAHDVAEQGTEDGDVAARALARTGCDCEDCESRLAGGEQA